jgi:M6 family metalloprotease-like protein
VQPGQSPLTGTFYLVAGGDPVQFFLYQDNGQVVRLEVDAKLLESAGGAWQLNRKRLAITGTQSAPSARAPGTPVITVSSIQLQTAPTPAPAPQAAVSGHRPFVNILCKFSDITAEPQTSSYFTSLMSNTYPGMDHYFREASYNTIDLVGTVVIGWLVLPQPRSYYVYGSPAQLDFDRIAKDCTAKADAQVNFNNFQGINLMFNYDLDGYAWGGAWGLTLDGTNKAWPMTWMPPWGYNNQTVLAHEMGHAFGMPHSANSRGQTYQNVWDVMSDTWRNCNLLTSPTFGCVGQEEIGYHKDIPGWIPDARKFILGGGTATITLERLDQPSSTGYLMAKIPIDDSTTDFYTVEARQRVGYDQKVPGNAVIIHRVTTTRLDPAWVIDHGNPNNPNTDTQWLPNQTFSDPATGISIAVNSATATGFVVTLVAPPFNCQPTINGSAVTQVISKAGQEKWCSFTVTTAHSYAIDTQSQTGLDNYMYLYGPNDQTKLIMEDDDSAGNLAAGIVVFLNPGTYYTKIRAYDSNATGSYSLQIGSYEPGQNSLCTQNFTDAYNRRGGSGVFGYPVGPVQQVGTSGIYRQPYRYQQAGQPTRFGAIYHDLSGGVSACSVRAFALSGNNYNYYNGLGGPAYKLGTPTSDEFQNDNNQWQANFANGYIVDNNGTVQETAWPSSFSGWKAQYFNNASLYSGPSLLRNEGNASSLDFNYDWGLYSAPMPKLGLTFADSWSARWQRTYTFTPGTYLFTLCGDDGVRLYLNGVRVIDQWQVQVYPCFTYRKTYHSSTSVPVTIEYYQNVGGEKIGFSVIKPLLVTVSNDDPTGNTAGTLSYALNSAESDEIVGFAPNITSVTVNKGFTLKNVSIYASCPNGSPGVTIDASAASPTTGFKLQGNSTLYGLKIRNYKGKGIELTGAGNKLGCTNVAR